MQAESWKTVYFREKGRVNTEETLRLAKERADALGIKNVVVSSYTGETGVRASEVFKGYNLIKGRTAVRILIRIRTDLTQQTGE
jgi:hypothetical protein